MFVSPITDPCGAQTHLVMCIHTSNVASLSVIHPAIRKHTIDTYSPYTTAFHTYSHPFTLLWVTFFEHFSHIGIHFLTFPLVLDPFFIYKLPNFLTFHIITMSSQQLHP